MTRCWMAVLVLVVLGGCTISTPPKPEPASDVQAAPAPVELDKSNTFIAEITVPMAQLGAKLRALATFDKHNKWSDAYIKETLTAASLLSKNDRLQGEMLATMDNESALIEVNIIRLEEDRYAVRVVSSFKKLSDAIDTELMKK
ncbi:MAG: hypothetical protein KF836_12130 [Fimbriimonadaceae bacterium]|nr:hypothetical protein [Fimbriimonadaceae bacterium]